MADHINSRAYQPRRSSASLLDGAPSYVMAAHDNGGKSKDRYTVFFNDPAWEDMDDKVLGLLMSDSPDSPEGFTVWLEEVYFDSDRIGDEIRWIDLPEAVRDHVIAFIDDDCVAR